MEKTISKKGNSKEFGYQSGGSVPCASRLAIYYGIIKIKKIYIVIKKEKLGTASQFFKLATAIKIFICRY